MRERACTKCGVVKPVDGKNFTPNENYADGFERWCIDCRLAYNTARQTADRKIRPEFYKAREFAREMKKYGTTVEWYRDKLIEQLGVCAVCGHLSYARGAMQRLQVDHSHSCCDLKTKSCGKCLRGLLCADCNVNLSYLEKFLAESEVMPTFGTWTSRALQYLTKFKERTQHA